MNYKKRKKEKKKSEKRKNKRRETEREREREKEREGETETEGERERERERDRERKEKKGVCLNLGFTPSGGMEGGAWEFSPQSEALTPNFPPVKRKKWQKSAIFGNLKKKLPPPKCILSPPCPPNNFWCCKWSLPIVTYTPCTTTKNVCKTVV